MGIIAPIAIRYTLRTVRILMQGMGRNGYSAIIARNGCI